MVSFCSVTKSCPTLCDPRTAAHQASLSFTISCSLLKSCLLSRWCHPAILTLCHLLLLLPSIFLSIRVFPMRRLFTSGGQTIGTSAPVLTKNISGLISFRIYWFDLLAVQGTLKSLLQYHSLKVSILWRLALFNGSALTSIHDYWKNHSFDYMELCQQSFCSLICYLGLS